MQNKADQEAESPYFKLDLMNEKRERIDSSTPEPPSHLPNVQNFDDLTEVAQRHFPLSTKEN